MLHINHDSPADLILQDFRRWGLKSSGFSFTGPCPIYDFDGLFCFEGEQSLGHARVKKMTDSWIDLESVHGWRPPHPMAAMLNRYVQPKNNNFRFVTLALMHQTEEDTTVYWHSWGRSHGWRLSIVGHLNEKGQVGWQFSREFDQTFAEWMVGSSMCALAGNLSLIYGHDDPAVRLDPREPRLTGGRTKPHPLAPQHGHPHLCGSGETVR